jgi:hypothetical protein
MSFYLNPWPSDLCWVKPGFMRRDMNLSQGRHSRPSGNLGKTGLRLEPGMIKTKRFMSSCIAKQGHGYFSPLEKISPDFHFPP